MILNRVEDPRYPDTVCGVVYQNAHRRNACQFSFACDGQSEAITDRTSWKAAVAHSAELLACDEECRASDRIGAAFWSATHYHADYVSPRWAKKLKRIGTIGAHLFYAEHIS
ncbi:Cell wall hydrolyses involved in spore germination [Lutibaculum baratangense AMV1]|uniref:Cell wall hydrolyses involved in spore germination n=1 Tax=Lutibaculum baratangense AMV1 TaxID=631454 RepID=V4RJL5_9HYPH|nr:Cell wall hydrolyses involved in spore germination [Lutibaculum baratangense AMV1]